MWAEQCYYLGYGDHGKKLQLKPVVMFGLIDYTLLL
jgi:hypothetical protein